MKIDNKGWKEVNIMASKKVEKEKTNNTKAVKKNKEEKVWGRNYSKNRRRRRRL